MIHCSIALHVIDSITVAVIKKITDSPPTITSVVKTAPGNRKEKKLNCGSCSSPEFSDYWELSCLNNELQIPSSFVHDVVSMDLCVRRLFKYNHCNIHRLVVLPKYSPIYSFLLTHNFYLPFRPRLNVTLNVGRLCAAKKTGHFWEGFFFKFNLSQDTFVSFQYTLSLKLHCSYFLAISNSKTSAETWRRTESRCSDGV